MGVVCSGETASGVTGADGSAAGGGGGSGSGFTSGIARSDGTGCENRGQSTRSLAAGWSFGLAGRPTFAGAPFAMALSWFYELAPEGFSRDEEVAPESSIARQT